MHGLNAATVRAGQNPLWGVSLQGLDQALSLTPPFGRERPKLVWEIGFVPGACVSVSYQQHGHHVSLPGETVALIPELCRDIGLLR